MHSKYIGLACPDTLRAQQITAPCAVKSCHPETISELEASRNVAAAIAQGLKHFNHSSMANDVRTVRQSA